jgi:hypothetical protein
MKKVLLPLFLLIGIFLMLLVPGSSYAKNKKDAQPAPSPSPAASVSAPSNSVVVRVADVRSNKPTALLDALSRTRVYIEFFYMETGDYPDNLMDLEKDLNSLLPKNLESVRIPKDPATGKDFVYKVNPNHKSYSLSSPDPGQYSIENFQISNVPWGGFNTVVEERKNSFLQRVCAENLKGLATAIEYYAKDNKKKVPEQLKALLSQYVRTIPVCPLSGKPYDYKSDGNDYTLSCPNPELHNMKKLMFTSKQGWITE